MIDHRAAGAALVALLLSLAAGGPAGAADFSDPSWPCVQRKVERLSVGLMWPHPIEETALPAETEAAVEDLAGRLALRRLTLEELQPAVTEFVATYGSDPALLGQVFQRTFDRMARTRGAIMTGIAEYSTKQIALAERIGTARDEMDAIMATDSPDYDRVDALEEQVDWDERIYTDRQRSLTYVCETPVLLEKRLYAVAQMLQAAAN